LHNRDMRSERAMRFPRPASSAIMLKAAA
jgi:hypothetical protein